MVLGMDELGVSYSPEELGYVGMAFLSACSAKMIYLMWAILSPAKASSKNFRVIFLSTTIVSPSAFLHP
jgi:hypothetical protein